MYRWYFSFVALFVLCGQGAIANAQSQVLSQSKINQIYEIPLSDRVLSKGQSLALRPLLYSRFPALNGRSLFLGAIQFQAKGDASGAGIKLKVGTHVSAVQSVSTTGFAKIGFAPTSLAINKHLSEWRIEATGPVTLRSARLLVLESQIQVLQNGILKCSPQIAMKDSTTNYECTAAIKIEGGKPYYAFFTGSNRWNPTTVVWTALTKTTGKTLSFKQFGANCSAIFDPVHGIVSSTDKTLLPQYSSLKRLNCEMPTVAAKAQPAPSATSTASTASSCAAASATVTHDLWCGKPFYRSKIVTLPASANGKVVTWPCSYYNHCSGSAPPTANHTGSITCVNGKWKITTASGQTCQVQMPNSAVGY